MFKRKDDDCVYFGDTAVKIPKLTVAKWQLLFDKVETLPQIIVNVLSSMGSNNFLATAVVGATMALDEAVNLVAAITDLEPEFVANNADLNNLIEFIVRTVKKNSLDEAAKKLAAVFDAASKKATSVK